MAVESLSRIEPAETDGESLLKPEIKSRRPTALLALLPVLLILFLALSYFDWASNTEQQKLFDLTINAERILSSDVEARSALQLASALKAPRYIDRYINLSETKSDLIDQSIALVKSTMLLETLSELQELQSGVDEIEAELVQLVREKDWEEAVILANEPFYKREIGLYRAKLSSTLRLLILEEEEEAAWATTLFNTMRVLSVCTIALICILGFLYARSIRIGLEKETHLATRLEQINNTLETSVEERTREATVKGEQLQTALTSFPGGLILTDPDLRIVISNPSFQKLLDLPSDLLEPGRPYPDVLEFLARRGDFGEGDIDELVLERVQSLIAPENVIVEERTFHGTMLEMRRNASPEGGALTVISDVTQRYEAEARLNDAYRVISDSITYASRIQRALLPLENFFNESFYDHFVIWQPRDVVGGDMHWFSKDRRGYFVALFDCTGHGVPGAFMTMITVSALTIAFAETADPARLISRVNQIVKTALRQDSESGESDDGLEIGICLVEPERQRMTFAGARFDLFVVEQGELQVVKGDKLGLGYRRTPNTIQINTHSLRLNPGTRFYMSSDGIIDQVGGEKRRAFGKKRLGQVLSATCRMTMKKQAEIIRKNFEEFQGSEKRRDDISIIGIQPLP